MRVQETPRRVAQYAGRGNLWVCQEFWGGHLHWNTSFTGDRWALVLYQKRAEEAAENHPKAGGDDDELTSAPPGPRGPPGTPLAPAGETPLQRWARRHQLTAWQRAGSEALRYDDEGEGGSGWLEPLPTPPGSSRKRCCGCGEMRFEGRRVQCEAQ